MNHHRQPDVIGDLELANEQADLRVTVAVLAIVVEPGLADRHHAFATGQMGQARLPAGRQAVYF